MHDYHLHTCRCGHARGSMEEYVWAARDRGIKEIGFADHLPAYWLPPEERDPGLTMSPDSLPGYVREVHSLQKKHRDMTIWLGIEADYIPGREEELVRVLSRYPFDYVLGSVHFIDGWGFDDPRNLEAYRGLDMDRLYRRYFQLLQQAAACGWFDIIAHPDLVKKFGYGPPGELQDLYRQTARTFRQYGVRVELNTAGLRAPVNEIYPHPDFVKECAGQGLKFTLGSDAHSPEQVGEGLEEAVKLVDSGMIATLRDKHPQGPSGIKPEVSD